MYPNVLYSLVPYYGNDRGDDAYGGEATISHGLGNEWYLSLYGQYSRSDGDGVGEKRGVKITETAAERAIKDDPIIVVMPSLKKTGFAKSALKTSFSVDKVFNFAKYYFTFPLSLRREAISLQYARYDIEPFHGNTNIAADEISVALTLDTLIMNITPIPITLTYLHNDNDDIAEEHTFRFSMGLLF